MPTTIYPDRCATVSNLPTGRVINLRYGPLAYNRLPADPLFYFTLTLQNIVVGSRYRIAKADDNTELVTGVAASTTEVVNGIAAYSSDMLVKISVRKASSAPKYEPLDAYVTAAKLGATAYIAQQPDAIA